MEIKITIQQLEALLDQQKELVIEKLLNSSSYYNGDNTDGVQSSLKINKERFEDSGRKSSYPHDFKVLTKYLK